ncbi:hypothetical protein [Microcoleus anatoxicus]|uniref:Uncharacterized protein n=1 Tax=Microcoleus anatoxicus PTRS2 TaxID=2705321 RepID=A0ABU8YFW7_9CYAN
MAPNFSDRTFTLSKTSSPGTSRFYCPRPGLQSTKANASVPLKTGDRNGDRNCDRIFNFRSTCDQSRLNSFWQASQNDFGISRRKLFLKFGLHGRCYAAIVCG